MAYVHGGNDDGAVGRVSLDIGPRAAADTEWVGLCRRCGQITQPLLIRRFEARGVSSVPIFATELTNRLVARMQISQRDAGATSTLRALAAFGLAGVKP